MEQIPPVRTWRIVAIVIVAALIAGGALTHLSVVVLLGMLLSMVVLTTCVKWQPTRLMAFVAFFECLLSMVGYIFVRAGNERAELAQFSVTIKARICYEHHAKPIRTSSGRNLCCYFEVDGAMYESCIETESYAIGDSLLVEYSSKNPSLNKIIEQ